MCALALKKKIDVDIQSVYLGIINYVMKEEMSNYMILIINGYTKLWDPKYGEPIAQKIY